ncbi:MAG: hypothetical protein FWF80_02750 [Defluviitaleaceae bacterium]|nr:hypothetical protein [Defluviitaleaceae bacterium]
MRFKKIFFALVTLIFVTGLSACGGNGGHSEPGENDDPSPDEPTLFVTHYTAYIQGAYRPNDVANLIIFYVTSNLYAGDDNFFEEISDIRVRIIDVDAAGNATVSWDSDEWDDTIFASRNPSDLAVYFTEHIVGERGLIQQRTELEIRGVVSEEGFGGTLAAPDIGFFHEIQAYPVENNRTDDAWSVNFNGNWIE